MTTTNPECRCCGEIVPGVCREVPASKPAIKGRCQYCRKPVYSCDRDAFADAHGACAQDAS